MIIASRWPFTSFKGVTAAQVTEEGQSHRLGVAEGTALFLGGVLGPGVLVLPALADRAAGPAAVLAWVALLGVSALVAPVFAALGGRHPDGGGVASFVGRAFGPRASAAVGWWFYFGGVPAGVLGGALVGGQYVAQAVGGDPALAGVVAGALVAAACLANLAGLRVSGRAQLVLVALLVALLVSAVAVAAPDVRAAHFHPFAPHGWAAVGQAATVLCYGFSGWEAASHLSAEFANPRRLLPRVTALTLSVVAVLYCGLAVVTPGVLGPAAATTPVPLTALLARGLGPAAGAVTASAAVLLTFGAINTYLAGGARLGAALGRDGALPRWFAAGSGPRHGLLALAGMCALLGLVSAVWSVDLAALMRVAAACLTAVTAAGTAAAVRLLPPGWLRRCALLATAATLGVLACWGPLLLVPAGLGLAACLRRPRRRARRGETGVTTGVR